MQKNVHSCSTFLTFHCLPAVSEVSGSLQPDMVFFSSGERDDDEMLRSLQVQSLDALLDRSPKHPPNYTLRKGFNGETLQGDCA